MKQITIILSVAFALVFGLFLVTNVAPPVSADGGSDQVLNQKWAVPGPTNADVEIISAEGEGHEITMGNNCKKPPRRPPPCNGPPGRDPGNS